MSGPRRHQALKAGIIIEDDAYADLYFGGRAPRPLLADAPHKTHRSADASSSMAVWIIGMNCARD